MDEDNDIEKFIEDRADLRSELSHNIREIAKKYAYLPD